MNESRHIEETEIEDHANEQAEQSFALETMGPQTWQLASDSVNEDVADLLASDPDALEVLSDEFSDYLDTLDAEIDEIELSENYNSLENY